MFSDSDTGRSSSPLFFDEDQELPIFSETTTGYSVQEIVDILMDQSLAEDKVCQIQPLGVNRNCTFIIDLDAVSVEDMKADDMGSWKSNGTRRSFFRLNGETCEFIKSSSPKSYVIIRRYYTHHSYSKFRRCIIIIQGE